MHNLPIYILPSLLIAAALIDVMSLRIPNWLTVLTALLFFPMALAVHMPWAEFQWHLLAGALLLVAGYILFALRVFGAGDGKLMAAAGLWFGTFKIFPFLLFTALAGGLLAISVATWSFFMLSWEIEGDAAPFASLGNKLRTLKPSVPYGFAFAIGGILAFKDTWWMHALL